MDKINDIILELKKRDYTHFEVFYEMTKNQVFFAIIHIIKDQGLAEDLLQETYMKFLEKIDQYQDGKNPYAYLTSIGRNLAINLYNHRKKEVIGDEMIDYIPSDETKEDDDQDDIFKLLDHLDLIEKEIVTMHVINDLKFREIAGIMKKPLGTVLWIYNKAIKKLKEKVGESYDA
ncbi:MAG: RNA polymerase sigma factor [Acholeplasmataceae bacterium]|jgi:RNA polymerase sigma-70 factor (ECF subfamily)|nr:RNA polymerase sigma factor [Acholeplasmataceae bacterium]